jgi:predicted type IV restriction endonuclease
MPAPAEVLELVDRFKRERPDKSLTYNETELRREYVDPLLKALGWDVDNKGGFADAYKDIVHEDSVRIEGVVKSPDYSLRLGGVRKLFIETKRPSINLKKDPSPAFQLRRYAWSAKLPVSILTDFGEFVVYDTRVRPKESEKASTARLMYFTLDEYDAKWEELVNLFSPDGIRRGGLDRYTKPLSGRRGAAQVDDAFLKEMEGWRETLAKKLRSPK